MLYASGSFMMSIISLPGTLGIAMRSFVIFEFFEFFFFSFFG